MQHTRTPEKAAAAPHRHHNASITRRISMAAAEAEKPRAVGGLKVSFAVQAVAIADDVSSEEEGRQPRTTHPTPPTPTPMLLNGASRRPPVATSRRLNLRCPRIACISHSRSWDAARPSGLSAAAAHRHPQRAASTPACGPCSVDVLACCVDAEIVSRVLIIPADGERDLHSRAWLTKRLSGCAEDCTVRCRVISFLCDFDWFVRVVVL